jgi:hypothetical protein
MKHKIIYQISKALILLTIGLVVAYLYRDCSLLIIFFAMLFSGVALDMAIFQKIEQKKGWGLWK